MGCSPSLSGAIRVNPWSIESVADGIYAAIKMPQEHQQLRHEKHWRYVSQHTVNYWAQSYVTDLQVGHGSGPQACCCINACQTILCDSGLSSRVLHTARLTLLLHSTALSQVVAPCGCLLHAADTPCLPPLPCSASPRATWP